MNYVKVVGGVPLVTTAIIAFVVACSSTDGELNLATGTGMGTGSGMESSSSASSSSSSSSSGVASSSSSSSSSGSSSSSSSSSSSGAPCPMCPAYQDCDAGACWGCAPTNLDCTFKAPQTLGVACEPGYYPPMADCSYQGNQPQFPYKPTYCCLPK